MICAGIVIKGIDKGHRKSLQYFNACPIGNAGITHDSLL